MSNKLNGKLFFGLFFFLMTFTIYTQFIPISVNIGSTLFKGNSYSYVLTLGQTAYVDAGQSFGVTINRSAGSGSSIYKLRLPDGTWIDKGSHTGSSWYMGSFSQRGDYWAVVDGSVLYFTISDSVNGQLDYVRVDYTYQGVAKQQSFYGNGSFIFDPSTTYDIRIYLKSSIGTPTFFYKVYNQSGSGYSKQYESSAYNRYFGSISDSGILTCGVDMSHGGPSFAITATVAPSNYAISGQVKSRRWPYKGVPGITVSSDTGQSTTTALDGTYTLASVPAGSRTITARHPNNDYWATTGNADSAVQSITLSGNATVNFTDFACKGTAEATISLDKTTASPGETVNVTVVLRNANFNVINVRSYLDLSFPMDKVASVGTPSGSGWSSVVSYPVGSTIYTVDASGGEGTRESIDYLVSGELIGRINFNSTISFTVPIILKSNATYGTITLMYRGTIGDERDPDSSGSGALDQQGWNIKTQDITVQPALPEAPANEITGQPSAIYPGVPYEISTYYYDVRGASDLHFCYFRIDHPTGNDLTMGYNQNTGEIFLMQGNQGEDYLSLDTTISDVTELTGTKKGYKIVWKFRLKPNWQVANSGIRFGVQAVDDSGLTSGWNSDSSNSIFSNPTGVTILVHGYNFGGDGSPIDVFNPIDDYWDKGREFIVGLLKASGGGEVYAYNRSSAAFVRDTRTKFTENGLDNSNGEKILVFDWAVASDDLNSGHAEAAAEVLFVALADPNGDGVLENTYIDLSNPSSSKRLHFIGHSRGTVVSSEVIQRLGVYNIPVHYVTYLDPHDFAENDVPADGTFHDPSVQIWNNVRYADNFWQSAVDPIIPSGHAIEHLMDGNIYDYYLNGLIGFGHDGAFYLPLKNTHSKVIDWYLGTITPGVYTQSWYSDQKGYIQGFSLWRSRGSYSNSSIENGIIATATPKPVGNIVRYPNDDGTNYDDDYALTNFFNGLFDLRNPQSPLELTSLSGWDYFGGSGTGHVANGHLELDTFNSTRTHNLFYIPVNAKYIRFKFKVNIGDGGTPPDSDQLQMLIGSSIRIDKLWLDVYKNDQYANVDITSYANSMQTLKFRIVPNIGIVNSEVWIDDIQFIFDTSVPSKPVTPIPILPADEAIISTLTPSFDWSAFEHGGDNNTQVGYQLRVRCDTDADTIVYDTGFVSTTSAHTHTYTPGAYSGTDPVTGDSRVSSALQWGKHYHWHVRYQDSEGDWSNWSADDLNVHQDFYTQLPQITISGTILVGGSPLAGVVMNGLPGNPVTDGAGFYTATVSYGWSCTVTPTLAGYTFSPANRTYTSVIANQAGQNYTATGITYTISGSAGIAGATLSYTDGTAKTATADGSGNYSFTVSYNWSGTVTPTLAGYTFSPTNRVYTNVTANQTAQNYTATLVLSPTLQLTSPNGGDYWTLGTAKNITWTATNYSGTVRLVLFRNGAKLGNIATGLSALAGSYSWTVGQYSGGTAPAGSGYRLYLRSTDNTLVDASDTWFNLIAPAQLQLTSPNGGESWASGSQHAITWNANGYSGNVRLVLFSNTAKKGQIAANIPAANGSYLWTVGVTKYATVPAGSMYSVRLLASDASQQDYSDSPFAITAAGALVADHRHTELNGIAQEWLETTRRQQQLLVMSAGKDDTAALGLRLLGSRDPRFGVATDDASANMGLALQEAIWQPKGIGFDLQEWRWSLEQAALESGATVVLIKADEAALRSGRLDAAGYISVLRELAERLPGVALVCSTMGMDQPDEPLEQFNRQVREYVLQTNGVLLDTADIESWHGGEQALQDESPVRHAAYREDSGLPCAENLNHQGAAIWWLLARLAGLEESAVTLAE